MAFEKMKGRLDAAAERLDAAAERQKVEAERQKADRKRSQAQKAWDDGHRHYAPCLRGGGQPVSLNDLGSGGVYPKLGFGQSDWAALLAEIEDIGWVLDSWSVALDPKRGCADAYPLFHRPAEVRAESAENSH